MYGSVVKRIRLKKGMKQKEVYLGVVSKSFYSDFEAEKNSVEVEKFFKILGNLNISFTEFEYYKKSEDSIKELEQKIDTLYSRGNFEELYAIYIEFYNSSEKEIRYLAIKSYLLVLITNANFYQFSREPFHEIISEINNITSWHLKEITLSKLVLLSLTESDKKQADELFNRILTELEKYKVFDAKVYYEEVGDLLFNRIQSLLIINDVEQTRLTCSLYKKLINESDNLYLIFQYHFIEKLVNLYLDFPTYKEKLSIFFKEFEFFSSSEFNFYKIIFKIHEEKARNYYSRYIKN